MLEGTVWPLKISVTNYIRRQTEVHYKRHHRFRPRYRLLLQSFFYQSKISFHLKLTTRKVIVKQLLELINFTRDQCLDDAKILRYLKLCCSFVICSPLIAYGTYSIMMLVSKAVRGWNSRKSGCDIGVELHCTLSSTIMSYTLYCHCCTLFTINSTIGA